MDYENELRILAPKAQREKLYRSFAWVAKVIDSCISEENIPYCELLIEKFYKLHGSGVMANMLSQALDDKYDTLKKQTA